MSRCCSRFHSQNSLAGLHSIKRPVQRSKLQCGEADKSWQRFRIGVGDQVQAFCRFGKIAKMLGRIGAKQPGICILSIPFCPLFPDSFEIQPTLGGSRFTTFSRQKIFVGFSPRSLHKGCAGKDPREQDKPQTASPRSRFLRRLDRIQILFPFDRFDSNCSG